MFLQHNLAEMLESRRLLSAGAFDPSFGNSGRSFDPQAVDGSAAKDIATQKDGKILLATAGGVDGAIALRRYLPSGSLDASFASAGIAHLSFGGRPARERISVVAIQKDGKILVGGTSGASFAVARLNSDGSLDSHFGNAGVQTAKSSANSARVNSLVIDASGRIVLAGRFGENIGLARFTGSGAVDKSFATKGVARINVTNRTEHISDILIKSDGKLFAVGATTGSHDHSKLALMQFTSSGALDATFGTNGIRIINTAGRDVSAMKLKSLGGGKYLIGASGFGFITRQDRYYIETSVALLARVNANGTVDSSFGDKGFFIQPAEFDPESGGQSNMPLSDVDIAADGSIYIGGANRVFHASKSGKLDAAYKEAGESYPGKRVWLYSVDTSVSAIRATGNGVLVAATGKLEDGNGGSVGVSGVVKYTSSAIDQSFGTKGRAAPELSGRVGEYDGMFSLADGRFIVVGETLSLAGNGYDFLIERHLADGSLDKSFGANGRAAIDVRGTNDAAREVFLARDGSLLVVGTSEEKPQAFTDSAVLRRASLVRLTANGKLDKTFADNGRFIYAGEPDAEDDGTAVLELSDGKILVGVYRDSPAGAVLLRLSSSGALDKTFGTDGAKILPGRGVVDLLPTSNGKVIVAQENRLSRLTVSGALDKNFGEFFSTSQFHVVPLPDGKFAGAGQAANSEGYLDYALFRFNSNGTLDHSFDGDGITSLPPTGSTRGAEDLVAQSDGKLIGIGADGAVRFNTDGSVDKKFGNRGSALPGPHLFKGLITPSGRLLLAGRTVSDANQNTPFLGEVTLANDQPAVQFARLTHTGTLQINGTSLPDDISIELSRGKIQAIVNGQAELFSPADVKRIFVDAGAGNDQVANRTSSRSTILGGDGADSLYGGSGPDSIDGGRGNDMLYGQASFPETFGNDTLIGGEGDDQLDGLAGDDQLFGKAGYDTLTGGAGNDFADGGAGDDEIAGGDLYGDAGHDTLHGGEGNDSITVGNGPSQLFGDAGNDTLFSGNGAADRVDGGAGFDRANADGIDDLIDIESLVI